jgi:hypothetical protein
VQFFPGEFHSSLAKENAARKIIQLLYLQAPRGITASFLPAVIGRARW